MTSHPQYKSVLICSAASAVNNGRLIKCALSLRETGYNVYVASSGHSARQLEVNDNVFVPHFPTNRRRYIADKQGTALHRFVNGVAFKLYRLELERLIKTLQPNILHAIDYESLAAVATIKTDAKLVYDSAEFFRDTAAGSDIVSANYIDRLYETIADKIEALITVSEPLAQKLQDAHPALPNATVIPNSVRVPHDLMPVDLRSELKIESNKKIAIFHGAFNPNRGIKNLIQAANHLPEWIIVLLGDGAIKYEVQALVNEHFSPDCSQRPRIMTPVKNWDLINMIAGADVGIIPYEAVSINHEIASPNKLYEYPAAGLPLIVTDLPYMSDTVLENGMGWSIGAENITENLVECLQGITQHDLDAKAKAARLFASKNDWQTDSAGLYEIYERLLTRDSLAS